jgi:hypothetical protein
LNRESATVPDEKIKPDYIIAKFEELPGLL